MLAEIASLEQQRQLTAFAVEFHKLSASTNILQTCKFGLEQWKQFACCDDRLIKRLRESYGLALDQVTLLHTDQVHVRYRLSPTTIAIDSERLQHLRDHLDYCKGAVPHNFTKVWRRGYKIMIEEVTDQLVF